MCVLLKRRARRRRAGRDAEEGRSPACRAHSATHAFACARLMCCTVRDYVPDPGVVDADAVVPARGLQTRPSSLSRPAVNRQKKFQEKKGSPPVCARALSSLPPFFLYSQTHSTLLLPRLTGGRPWAVVRPRTVRGDEGGRERSAGGGRSVRAPFRARKVGVGRERLRPALGTSADCLHTRTQGAFKRTSRPIEHTAKPFPHPSLSFHTTQPPPRSPPSRSPPTPPTTPPAGPAPPFPGPPSASMTWRLRLTVLKRLRGCVCIGLRG